MSMTDTEYLTGGDYAVIFDGGFAWFYDDVNPEFKVSAHLADTQEMRDALATVYDLGVEDGRLRGKLEAKRDIRRAIGIENF